MNNPLKHLATTSHSDKAYLFTAALEEMGIITHIDDTMVNQPSFLKSHRIVKIYVDPERYEDARQLLQDSEEYADIAEGNVAPIQMQTDAWSGLWQPIFRLLAIGCAIYLFWHFFFKWFAP